MAKARIVIAINSVVHLKNKKTRRCDNYLLVLRRKGLRLTVNSKSNEQISITLIGMSALATGQPQSLNIFCKKSTYLESMSLRNKLLTYWSKIKTIVKFQS